MTPNLLKIKEIGYRGTFCGTFFLIHAKKYVFSYCIKKPTAHAFTYNDWRIEGRSLFKQTQRRYSKSTKKQKKSLVQPPKVKT